MTSARRPERPALARRLGSGLWQHRATLWSSLLRLAQEPLGTALTVAVMAIALALPAGLYLALENASALSAAWQRVGEITVFLEADGGDETAAGMAASLSASPAVASARVIAPDAALAMLEARGEFGAALAALEGNPLPWTIAATPHPGASETELETLVGSLRETPGVALAQFDMEWLIRLNSAVVLGQRLVQLVAALLTLGVLLIVGNTIRLDIQNRREEIEIIRMLGGTDGFIRRPFLYAGAWLGLASGLAALGLLVLTLVLLEGPAQLLVQSYGAASGLEGPGVGEVAALVGIAVLLGWCGAWLAVRQHLVAQDAGEPR